MRGVGGGQRSYRAVANFPRIRPQGRRGGRSRSGPRASLYRTARDQSTGEYVTVTGAPTESWNRPVTTGYGADRQSRRNAAGPKIAGLVGIAVGAALDLVSGITPRAPQSVDR